LFKKVYNKKQRNGGIIMKKFNFPVIIEVDEDGVYIVSCPLFKGCHSYGNTIEEAIQNIKEVIEMCLEEINLEELSKYVGIETVEINIPVNA
jgi:predicted RNase H-like HicB family nuclease